MTTIEYKVMTSEENDLAVESASLSKEPTENLAQNGQSRAIESNKECDESSTKYERVADASKYERPDHEEQSAPILPLRPLDRDIDWEELCILEADIREDRQFEFPDFAFQIKE